MPASSRRAGGRAGFEPDPAESPHLIRIVLPPVDPNVPPVRRPSSSRTLARLREKAEAAARAAEACRNLARQVQPGLRPPPGRLFATDAAGRVLRGPAGGIGSSLRIIETLQLLSQGGRHPSRRWSRRASGPTRPPYAGPSTHWRRRSRPSDCGLIAGRLGLEWQNIAQNRCSAPADITEPCHYIATIGQTV